MNSWTAQEMKDHFPVRLFRSRLPGSRLRDRRNSERRQQSIAAALKGDPCVRQGVCRQSSHPRLCVPRSQSFDGAYIEITD